MATPQEIEGKLTDREREVLRLLLEGKAEKEIARELGIATSTVHGHVKTIYRLADVHSHPLLVAKFRPGPEQGEKGAKP